MANILSSSEAATVLRCETTDADMLALLPLIDAYIKNASGRDWAADSTINPSAKAAARILLVQWHEDPGRLASGQVAMTAGLCACLVQLEALACRYQVFTGSNGAGACTLVGAQVGDTVSTLVGVVGASGDQSTLFETVITVEGYIQQTSTSDLSAKKYRAYLLPPEAL